MSNYVREVVNAAILMLESLGYSVVAPETEEYARKSEVIVALGQEYEGNRRDLYSTAKGKWYLSYSGCGLLDVGQVSQETVQQLLREDTTELTYPDGSGCYKLKETQPK